MSATWKEATSLITPERFDILFKYIYAKLRSKNVKIDWMNEIYGHHLKVWNGLFEISPQKKGLEQYKKSFHDIIQSIEKNGFDKNLGYIPIDELTNSALNGAHRIAAAILFKEKVYCKLDLPSSGQLCSYYYLANRTEHVHTGLDPKLADAAAMEYCRLKKSTFVITIFPSAIEDINTARKIISENSKLVYEKEFRLTNNGPFNFVRFLYDDDASNGNPWLGNWQNGFMGAKSKMVRCFTTNQPVRVFLVEPKNVSMRDLKEQLRKFYRLGKHSVHINDTHEETLKIAGYVFNDNSIHFLNNCKPYQMKNFENYFQQLIDWLRKSTIDIEDICVDSSAVLSAYGLRDCRDLDFLYRGDFVNTGMRDISCHNEEINHYKHEKNDIIFNPNNHFYYRGVKFASINVVDAMKKNRGEEKDFKDCKLIIGVI